MRLTEKGMRIAAAAKDLIEAGKTFEEVAAELGVPSADAVQMAIVMYDIVLEREWEVIEGDAA